MLLNFKILQQVSKELSILYVEDDASLREKTAIVFKNLFKDIDVAQDGLLGLELYTQYYEKEKKYYDIIVSDIQMPRLDGIGLTKEILKINKDQKIIIISAYNDKEYLIDLINLGVEAFMQKPLSSQNLLQVLYDVCTSFNIQNIMHLKDNYSYNFSISTLFFKDKKVEISDNEVKLLELLLKNQNQSFNSIEIFNYLYNNAPEKEFSNDSIKSLVKRLRKKLPINIISNTQQLGYSISL